MISYPMDRRDPEDICGYTYACMASGGSAGKSMLDVCVDVVVFLLGIKTPMSFVLGFKLMGDILVWA